MQRQINYIDTKAKWCHLKKLTCKGALWQVFIRVYRLEIHTQSIMLLFSTQLCELLPLYLSLWFNSPPPPSLCQSTLYLTTLNKNLGDRLLV